MKILANRVDNISPTQFGYVKSRWIQDRIIIALDYINCVEKTLLYGGNMAFNLDIRKVSDTMSWDFIIDVLKYLVSVIYTFLQWIKNIFSLICSSFR